MSLFKPVLFCSAQILKVAKLEQPYLAVLHLGLILIFAIVTPVNLIAANFVMTHPEAHPEVDLAALDLSHPEVGLEAQDLGQVVTVTTLTVVDGILGIPPQSSQSKVDQPTSDNVPMVDQWIKDATEAKSSIGTSAVVNA